MDFEVILGDSLESTRAMGDQSVDLLITDPPYASLEKHRKTGTTTRLKQSKSSSNIWFPVIENEAFRAYFLEWLRVLKPGRHFYLFCDPETSYAVVPIALECGFKWGNRLIWDKQSIGMGYHYRRSYEDILFFVRPGGKKRRLANLGIADVLKCKRLKGKDYYPTEKPVPVLRTLVQQSAEKGELVFDPFSGSGSTGEAALLEGCKFRGHDVSEHGVALATERLQSLKPTQAPPWANAK